MKFHIITAMYNVDEWIEENIQLLKDQTYTNFQVVLVDDISTDKTVALVQAAIQGDDRFRLIINQEKKFKTRNVVEAIEAANPDDEDVIVLVDGDDRLAHQGRASENRGLSVSTPTGNACCSARGGYRGSLQAYRWMATGQPFRHRA